MNISIFGIKRTQSSLNLLFVFVIIVISILGSIGCSQKNTESGKTKVILGYYAIPGDSEKVMKELISEFESNHPDIDIVTQVAPYDEFFQKLKTQIAANQAPDIWLSDGVFVPSYYSRGVLKDLTPWIDRDVNRNDYLMLQANADTSGRIWGFPQGLQILALFYNKKLFDEAKLAYPTPEWTLDDMLTAAKKLTKDKNGDGKMDQYGFTITTNITTAWFPFIKQFGGMILDKSLTKAMITDPKTVAAIQYMIDLINKYKVAPDLADITAFGGYWNLFPSGIVAMQYGIYARSIAANNVGLDYDVQIIPKGPGGRVVPVIANSWVISNKSTPDKQAVAWEWIKFYSGKGPQMTWAKLGEAIPVNREAAYSDAFLGIQTPPKNRKVFLDSLHYAATMDVNGSWEEWTTAFDEAFEPALNGKANAKTTAELANKKIQAILDRVNKEK